MLLSLPSQNTGDFLLRLKEGNTPCCSLIKLLSFHIPRQDALHLFFKKNKPPHCLQVALLNKGRGGGEGGTKKEN